MDFTDWHSVNQLVTPQNALQTFIKEIKAEYNFSECGLYSVNINDDTLELEIDSGEGSISLERKIKINHGWIGKAAANARIIHGEARAENERYGLALPLEINEKLVGVFYARGDKKLSDQEIKKLQNKAQEFWKWLEYLWERDGLRRRENSLLGLLRTVRELVSHDDLGRVLNLVVRQAAESLRAKVSTLLLLDEDRDELYIRSAYGDTDSKILPAQPIHLSSAVVSVVVKRGRPLAIHNLNAEFAYPYTELSREARLASLLSVPLSFGEEVLGVLNLFTGESRRFANHEINWLQGLADMAAVAVEKIKLFSRLIEFENQLRQSERLSTIGLLAAEVAHEIRNPLMVMQMLLHGLEEDFPKDSPRRKDIEVVQEKAQQMNEIVKQILGLAKRSEPRREPVLIQEIIERLVHFLRPKLEEQRIETDINIATNHQKVALDRTQIEQALLNLSLNAIQAMPQGGRLSIRASIEESELPYLHIVIEDTGHGMSEDIKEKIFDSFLTTKADGSGLGMAIVRRIVENHRGKIEVESQLGKGTRVRLILPVEN
ncbi:MAG: ATP-binding protein [Methylacidiphilales bacterium]|nr:ATP-binding protein [Candidatus Methylacidiphilales bacterium]MDW8348709.1 ATP-binding protein [Verrucomicrobiae bacterium]